MALVTGNSWVWGVGHDLGFLPLYSFSDSCHSGMAISGASGLRLGRILSPDRSAENFLQLSRLDFFHLTSSSGRNGSIFENSVQTDFRKVPIRFQQGSSCILDNSYTPKCKTKTFCTFATINRLVQINNKHNIKTSARSIKVA